jgi:predicted enzyme related to lactoylglutathione lyase
MPRFTICCLCLSVCTTVAVRSAGPGPVDTVEAFRAAREAGDHELARSFPGADPRVRYEARAGEGDPLKLGAGRWRTWDEHFNGRSELGPWTVEADRVWAVAEETNDYFRLLEREDVSRYRITYSLDGDGKIEGYMISPADPDRPSPPRKDRFAEFEAWARAEHPEEWQYLRPGGKLDPTGDRAPRTRLLLRAWRKQVGLPALGDERHLHGVFTGRLKAVLYVAGVEKSAAFFQDVLGFELDGFADRADGRPYYAEMLAGGTKFGLHEPMSSGQQSRVGEQRLYFRVRDLEAHRLHVAARGGKPGEVKRTECMDMFVVRDPDGHEIVFALTTPERHSIDPW